MEIMNKYEFCTSCKKFKDMERDVLNNSDSAFDAASDMWNFVDNCCKNCEIFKNAVKEGKVKDE